MGNSKQHQEICVVGRLFSLEALVIVMGVTSLIYGLVTAQLINIIIGALVLVVTVALALRWRLGRLKEPLHREKL